MALPRDERMTPHDLLTQCRDQYERLGETSHRIPNEIAMEFKKKFRKAKDITFPEELNGIEPVTVQNEYDIDREFGNQLPNLPQPVPVIDKGLETVEDAKRARLQAANPFKARRQSALEQKISQRNLQKEPPKDPKNLQQLMKEKGLELGAEIPYSEDFVLTIDTEGQSQSPLAQVPSLSEITSTPSASSASSDT